MKRTVVRVLVVATAIVAAYLAGTRERQVKAAPQMFGSAACRAFIPRAWGEYRGGSTQSGLAFEASDGTLRFVTQLPCESTPQVALEIQRTMKAN
jgi:hypothetical protein